MRSNEELEALVEHLERERNGLILVILVAANAFDKLKFPATANKLREGIKMAAGHKEWRKEKVN